MAFGSCIGVMYHYVRDTEKTPFPAIKALAISEFEAQLDFLASAYRIVDFPTFEEIVRKGSTPKSPIALLTFDDGCRDHFETVFPILQRRKITGTFFIPDGALTDQPPLLNVHKIHFLLASLGAEKFEDAVRSALAMLSHEVTLEKKDRQGIYRYDLQGDFDVKKLLNYELPFATADTLLETLFRKHLGDSSSFARELYLTSSMVREMAASGMTFGGHTASHRVLSRLSREEQKAELRLGRERIAALTGQTSIPFCYPYGHAHTYNADTISLLKEIGFSLSFTALRSPILIGSNALHEIPRYDTKDLPPFAKPHA